MTLTIGSLFSGIGGFELGLEWAGLGPTLWQVEIDPFCRAVLAKHWPNVARFEDVTAIRDYPYVDIICGGFPCQDVSAAGLGAGMSGERSSLWWYFARTIQQVRPRFVIVENVASGKKRWLPAVRRHLHMLGYDSTAYAISAADVGAPHLRRRVFVVAYAYGVYGKRGADKARHTRSGTLPGRPALLADADGHRELQPQGRKQEQWRWSGDRSETVADADEAGREGSGPGAHVGRIGPAAGSGWAPEPAVGRVVTGLSGGLDGRKRRQRLRALGNTIVPQCAQVVGEVIQEMIAKSAHRSEVA